MHTPPRAERALGRSGARARAPACMYIRASGVSGCVLKKFKALKTSFLSRRRLPHGSLLAPRPAHWTQLGLAEPAPGPLPAPFVGIRKRRPLWARSSPLVQKTIWEPTEQRQWIFLPPPLPTAVASSFYPLRLVCRGSGRASRLPQSCCTHLADSWEPPTTN